MIDIDEALRRAGLLGPETAPDLPPETLKATQDEVMARLEADE